MTLARAADADSSVSAVEVETVQRIMQRETGDDVSSTDVRVAAASELFEQAPLSAYLRAARRDLLPEQRSRVLKCLIEAVMSDSRVTSGDVEFFTIWLPPRSVLRQRRLLDFSKAGEYLSSCL